jgi:hypothetical protein
LGGAPNPDCCGIAFYDHPPEDNPHKKTEKPRWNNAIKARCPNHYKIGACSRKEILDFVTSNNCCELVMLGHRGGDDNYGGIISDCSFDPKIGGRARVLPDPSLEFELKKHFDEKCKKPKRCKIWIGACSSAVFRAEPERLANYLGCIVCGTFKVCQASYYTSECKTAPPGYPWPRLDEAGEPWVTPHTPEVLFRCFDPATGKWHDETEGRFDPPTQNPPKPLNRPPVLPWVR